jgi:acyl-CoA synthetase (AMP-forming)/AMP-acid ligase II
MRPEVAMDKPIEAARTIPQALAAAVAAYPATEAVVVPGEGARLTYADLDAQVRLLVRGLVAVGIRPGDRLAVWAPNSDRWVIAALAAASMGATLVPVSTRLTGSEAVHILAATHAAALFVDRTFLAADRLAGLRTAAQGNPHPVAALGPVLGLPDLQIAVTLDGTVTLDEAELASDADGEDVLSWAELLDHAERTASTEVDRLAAAVRPEDPSDVLFTSGTTGRPKGVVLTHGQSVRAFRSWAEVVGLHAEDRYLAINPFSHTYGLKAGVLASILAGSTLLPMAVFDGDAAVEIIATERISVLPGPPTLYTTLLDAPGRSSRDLSSLRLAVTGAAAVPAALIIRMREELGFDRVLTGYGLTETTGLSTICRADDPVEIVSGTSGRPIDGVEVMIEGPDGEALPPGEPGEVLVRGFNVMGGYLDDPVATVEAINLEGWLHTGDVGMLDQAGNLTITDRLKDMYVVGGFNAYPAEIERVLAEHPAVSAAAVIGVPDERQGEVGRAYVVPRPGERPVDIDLVAFCKERLANYKVPRTIVLVDELPLNATGKVDKNILRTR